MKLPLAILCASQLGVNAEDFLKFPAFLPRDVDAVSIAPVFDFDSDGCLPAGGISQGGDINGGQHHTGSITGACRSTNFMDQSNTYHRNTCVSSGGSDYCVHLYSLYFEKDQLISGVESGHRHDWESVAIWTKDGVITHGSASAHGDLDTRPANELQFENGHLKIVYHKEGVGSHAFRFADPGETAENPYGSFVTPDIITWFEFSSVWDNFVLRTILMTANYGGANLPMQDWTYNGLIQEFKPAEYPDFSWGSMFTNNYLDFPGHVYDNTFFQIQSTANSNICVDINEEEMVNNQNVQLWTCGDDSAHHQRWYHQPDTNQIRSLADPRYCLDAVIPIQDFSNVQIYACHSGYNQRWIREGSVLRVDTTPYILDANGGIAEGNNLITFNNWGGENQRWASVAAKEAVLSGASSVQGLLVANVMIVVAFIMN